MLIRFFLSVAIFSVPYSKAMVETAIVTSCILWISKRSFILYEIRSKEQRSENFLIDLGHAFCPVGNVLNQGICAFLLIGFVSVFGSSLPTQSLHGFFTKTIEGFAVYLMAIEVFQTRKQINRVIMVFMIAAFVNGLNTLLQYYWTHQDIFRHRILVEGYRATGAFQHPNMLGAYLTIAIPLSLALLFAKWKKMRQRIFFTVATGLLVWTLFLTFSRGAWMGLAIGLLFYIVIIIGRRVNPWIRSALIALSIVIGSLTVMHALELKNQLSVVKSDVATAQWRLDMWRECVLLVKARPFFGHGLNTFMPVMENHLISTQNPLAVGYSASYAHNCYLQMAVETGVLGLSAFLAIIFIFYRRVLSSLPTAQDARLLTVGLLSGLLAFLVHSAVDINFYSLELPILFWFMAGVVIALHNQLSGKTSYAIEHTLSQSQKKEPR